MDKFGETLEITMMTPWKLDKKKNKGLSRSAHFSMVTKNIEFMLTEIYGRLYNETEN